MPSQSKFSIRSGAETRVPDMPETAAMRDSVGNVQRLAYSMADESENLGVDRIAIS